MSSNSMTMSLSLGSSLQLTLLAMITPWGKTKHKTKHIHSNYNKLILKIKKNVHGGLIFCVCVCVSEAATLYMAENYP